MTAYQTAPAAPAGDPTAVLGRRYAAAIIDILLWVTVAAFLAVVNGLLRETIPPGISGSEACDLVNATRDGGLCFSIGDTVYYDDPDANTALPGLALLLFGLANLLLEAYAGGTLGKLACGIRVVRQSSGTYAGIGWVLLRRILWLIDGIPFCLPLVGIITSAASKGHRRVGDMAAGTLVVHKGVVGRPPMVPGLTVPTGYPTAPGYGGPGYGGPGYGGPAPAPDSWGPPPPAPGAPSGWTPPPSTPPAGGPWGAPPAPPAPSSPAPPAPVPPVGQWPAPASPPTAWDAPPQAPTTAESTGWDSPEPSVASTGSAAPADATVTMPAVDPNAPTGITEAVSSPVTAPEPDGVAPEPDIAPTEQPAGVDAPVWDADRNAYIQWDPALAQWMQWDDAAQQWRSIS